jgi:hypothetical protein
MTRTTTDRAIERDANEMSPNGYSQRGRTLSEGRKRSPAGYGHDDSLLFLELDTDENLAAHIISTHEFAWAFPGMGVRSTTWANLGRQPSAKGEAISIRRLRSMLASLQICWVSSTGADGREGCGAGPHGGGPVRRMMSTCLKQR